MEWNLDKLYISFEDDNFKKDFSLTLQNIQKYKEYVDKSTKDNKDLVKKLENYIKIDTTVSEIISKLMNFCQLSLSVNTGNQPALHALEVLQDKLSDLSPIEAKFSLWLGNQKKSELDKAIKSSKLLKEHEFYINEIYVKSRYILPEKEEYIIAKMKTTGSLSYIKLKDLLVSNLNVSIDGKDVPLTVARNMAYDKDEKVREKAYKSELKSYETIEDSVSACLNGIKGEFNNIINLRGYKSPLDNTLINSRMDETTLNTMLQAMEESMPHFRKYLRRKGELLGHKNGLPFYDLFAPMGNADMKFTLEEAKDFIFKNFKTFSNDLAEFANKAFNESWIDTEPRKGKVGGAFCSNLQAIKESRILTNFSGSFSDVVTLAHEIGHGYHGWCLNNQAFLNTEYPMPIAETASTFCETIVKNAALKEATKEEAFVILESEISDYTQIIVDIYSRFLFESEVFKRRQSSSLNSKELQSIMIDSQKKAYGEGLDENYLHPYMWICKPHYYDSDLHFYNFPYAFGLLFAKGLYTEYLKKGTEFIPMYVKLLSSTGKMNIYDLTKMFGIDIHSIDFWRSSLKIMEDEIDKFIEISKPQ